MLVDQQAVDEARVLARGRDLVDLAGQAARGHRDSNPIEPVAFDAMAAQPAMRRGNDAIGRHPAPGLNARDQLARHQVTKQVDLGHRAFLHA
ncbi:hypothetical protein [Burkholderia gladioli]|uniref:hypothetical protein n=1 Tax=Burkholderia gladioli TaxID=28095 RepID=UPI001640234F|nr:hypothetical protein [Burkholderia gladioli]